MLPAAEIALFVGTFPDFARLFYLYEQHVDGDEYGALLERY
jgi:hypothetical protein